MIEPIERFRTRHPTFDTVTIIDAYDSFTHNLVDAFLKQGSDVIVLRVKDISYEDVEANLGKYLVFSPGPGTPDEAGIYKSLILKYYQKVPILGVCLGMQAINEVFGGSTVKAPKAIHGKISIIHHNEKGIFKDIPNPTRVGRYHSLMCVNINPRFELQASVDGVPMAMRIIGSIASVQFHPESFLTEHGQFMIKNFLEGDF